MSDWISVDERRPSKIGVYLCFSSYGVGCAHFLNVFQDVATSNDEGMCNWDGVEYEVTHWMPLP